LTPFARQEEDSHPVSASSAVAQPETSVVRSTGEPLLGKIATAILAIGLGWYLTLHWRTVVGAIEKEWGELLFWTALIVVMNLFPVRLAETLVTLDMPLFLALALLYPPPVATLVGIVAALDVRELERRVTLVRAIFNRAQIGLCVLLASTAFHSVAGDLEPWPEAAIGTAAAAAAFHSVNMVLVTVYAFWDGIRVGRVMRDFSIGRVGQFVATYLGYGMLALVLARLFVDVGAWSVVSFLLPLVVARQALVWGKGHEALANRLQNRERLLERLLDRMMDERKDERLRISTDLHDDVLQSLIRISHLGSILKREVPSEGAAADDAEQVVRVSQETMEILRNVVGDLRKSPLGRGGLVPTLRGLASDLQLDWGAKVQVDVPGHLELPPQIQLVLYQAAKEAIVNALKHSQPSIVRVRLWRTESQVFLTAEDDGRGFEPESVDESTHFGIGLMRERVRLAGGVLGIQSELKHGTRLEVRFPIRPEAVSEPRPNISRH
jgi:signal transduction histidine kinase